MNCIFKKMRLMFSSLSLLAWKPRLNSDNGLFLLENSLHIFLLVFYKYFVYDHRQPKLTMRVTCGTILRNVKIAVNIKDLYGNPGNRFKKISIRRSS